MSLTGFSLGMNIFHFEAFPLSAWKSRFQATDLHKFELVGKALAHRWFLTYVWPLNGTVVCARLKKSKNHIISYHIISYHHTIYNLVHT
jgi:hypothetical protein